MVPCGKGTVYKVYQPSNWEETYLKGVFEINFDDKVCRGDITWFKKLKDNKTKQNIGSKVTAILLKRCILPLGGFELERVCIQQGYPI